MLYITPIKLDSLQKNIQKPTTKIKRPFKTIDINKLDKKVIDDCKKAFEAYLKDNDFQILYNVLKKNELTGVNDFYRFIRTYLPEQFKAINDAIIKHFKSK